MTNTAKTEKTTEVTPRFKVGDPIIIDSDDSRFMYGRYRVTEVQTVGQRYIVEPEDGGQKVRIRLEQAFAPDEIPPARRRLLNGTVVFYEAEGDKKCGGVAPGGFGVVIADKEDKRGVLIANVVPLGGNKEQPLAYMRASHRILKAVPITDEVIAALRKAAEDA
jgi:hypothetical protein